MIQRIQTIYLLLIVGLLISLFFFPVVSITGEAVSANWFLIADYGIASVLALATIFLYNNRPLQIKLGYVLFALLVIAYVLIGLDVWNPMSSGDDSLRFNIPLVFPAIAMILDILAITAIRKDDKKVRDSNRLR